MNVNRMKKRILLLLLVIPALVKAQDVMTETRQELTSPDGAYRFTFYQRAVGEDNAQMYYTLTYKNRPVIEESKLGVLIENQLFESALGIPNDTCHFWCENLKLTGTEHQKTDEIWKPVYGERAEVRDCYNEMTLKFKKGEGKGNQDGGYDKRKNYFMNIIVRAYNEGVAFRYHFPEMTNGLFLHIVGEQTSFTMPEGTMAYYERWAQGPYELRPLKGWGKEESERPLTLKLPDGLSVALLEAEMVDYVRGKFRLSAEKPSTLESARDMAQDVFLRLMEYKQMLRKETVRSMAFFIAHNLVVDYLRRYYRKQEMSAYFYEYGMNVTDDTESGVIANDLSAQENLKLLQLSPQRRTVYIMSRFQGKTAPEISEELCLSRRTIENHLLASRKKIREYIKSCI